MTVPEKQEPPSIRIDHRERRPGPAPDRATARCSPRPIGHASLASRPASSPPRTALPASARAWRRCSTGLLADARRAGAGWSTCSSTCRTAAVDRRRRPRIADVRAGRRRHARRHRHGRIARRRAQQARVALPACPVEDDERRHRRWSSSTPSAGGWKSCCPSASSRFVSGRIEMLQRHAPDGASRPHRRRRARRRDLPLVEPVYPPHRGLSGALLARASPAGAGARARRCPNGRMPAWLARNRLRRPSARR